MPDAPNQPGHHVLHAPWRDAYMQSLADGAGKPAPPAGGSFFAHYWANPQRDVENLVVARVGEGNTAGMILLNRYPYANGHLMAALGDGRSRLLDYEPAQVQALFSLAALATALVERTLEPQGVNIGLNQGTAAGAGVPDHLHVHIVPRWNGDVNFISVVGSVRVIPSALETMAERYRASWEQMQRE